MKRSSFLLTATGLSLGSRSAAPRRLPPLRLSPSRSPVGPFLQSTALATLRPRLQWLPPQPCRRHLSSTTATTAHGDQKEDSESVGSAFARNPALIKETSDLFYQQLFVAKDEKAAFHLYKILNSLTKNRAFMLEFGQKDGGRAIEQLFALLKKEAATHYSQEKILAVLGNLAQEEANRPTIAEKGAEELRKVLVSKSSLRSVLAQAVRLLNITLESKSQLPAPLFDGYVSATMDLMLDFSDKPDLQLQLIRLLGLLSTDCGFEDYKKLSPLGAAMLIRNLQAYIFEPLDAPFITNQMTETLQAVHRILSRRPSGVDRGEEERLAVAFQNTFLEHDSKARYAVLNGLNCVLLLADSNQHANPALKKIATEVLDLLSRGNPNVAAEVEKIRAATTH